MCSLGYAERYIALQRDQRQRDGRRGQLEGSFLGWQPKVDGVCRSSRPAWMMDGSIWIVCSFAPSHTTAVVVEVFERSGEVELSGGGDSATPSADESWNW